MFKQEIEKIKTKGVTSRELEDAKTHLRGRITLSMENSSVQASWYARQALFLKEMKTPEEKLAELEKVTNDQIQNVAKKVFKMNKMRVAVIGDVENRNIKFLRMFFNY